MKTSRIAALALIATAAAGFNAYAESSDNYQADFTQKSISTLSRAQVQATANDNSLRGLYSEQGDAQIKLATPRSDATLTREAVRAEAIKSRGVNLLPGSIG
jgi:hypothetical protein